MESYRTPNVTPSSQLHFTSGRSSLLRSKRFSTKLKRPAKSRLLTPSVHPRVQQRSSGKQSTRTVTAEEKHFKSILNKTWKCYKVSPLYSFDYCQPALRKFSSQLSAYVSAESRRGEAFLINNHADRAHFSVLKGYHVDSADTDAIEIRVESKGKDEQDNKVVLVVILCCVHRSLEVDQQTPDCFTVLPLMMSCGSVQLTHIVITWLQYKFGCKICPLTFTPSMLCWLVAMWAGFISDNSKEVQLVYSMPDGVRNISNLTMSINASHCKALWERIHKEDTDMFSEEEMKRFMMALESHFYTLFKMHLSELKLSKIGTSISFVGNDGRLKMYSYQHVTAVLGKLTEFALEDVIPVKV